MVGTVIEKQKSVLEKTKKKGKVNTEDQMEIQKKKNLDVGEKIKKASTLKEEITYISLLSLLLIICMKEFLLEINSIIETLICFSLKEKEYEAKKVINTLMDSLQDAQKTLIHQKKELGM